MVLEAMPHTEVPQPWRGPKVRTWQCVHGLPGPVTSMPRGGEGSAVCAALLLGQLLPLKQKWFWERLWGVSPGVLSPPGSLLGLRHLKGEERPTHS